MPEGDTVWLTAHRLHQALADRELTMFDLRVPQHATADLRGQTVREVVARGKHILLRTRSNLTLHTHLRMDGSWRIGRAGRRPPGLPEHMMRILLGNTEWWAAGYRVHDVALLYSSDEGRVVGHLGPDLLGPDWDAVEAVHRLGRGQEHWVYERAGQPCRRCRTAINRADQGPPPYQRGTYWCPSCQPI